MGVSRHRDATKPVHSAGSPTIWIRRHFNMAGQSLARLLHQPFASFMIVLVIAVTLALPAALNLIVKNAAAVSGSWENALDFSVFLNRDLSTDEAPWRSSRTRTRRLDVQIQTPPTFHHLKPRVSLNRYCRVRFLLLKPV